MTPSLTFLRRPASWTQLVSEYLIGLGDDLSGIHVWTPTRGAAVRIRRCLADRGVLSPRFFQPIDALLAASPLHGRLASREEREAAWARVLSSHSSGEILMRGRKSERQRHETAGLLCDLSDMLAEGALRPSSESLCRACPSDSQRWRAIASLYGDYLETLQMHGLTDRNEAILAALDSPDPTALPRKLVIACIPDLSRSACQFAASLPAGCLDILVAAPPGLPSGFDAWGRPDPDGWRGVPLGIAESQILTAREPAWEVRGVLEFLFSAPESESCSLVLNDPTLAGEVSAAVRALGGECYLPSGRPLHLGEPATVAVEWVHFQRTRDLRQLRRLLELPGFLRVLRGSEDAGCDANDHDGADEMRGCDFLIQDSLLVTLDDAVRFLAESRRSPDHRNRPNANRTAALHLIRRVKALLRFPMDRFLDGLGHTRSDGHNDLSLVRETWQRIAQSPLFEAETDEAARAFSRSIHSQVTPASWSADSLTLWGWLEAPWLPSPWIAMVGCTEGRLPSSRNAHPFLPDSKRAELGLPDNSSRRARDAYQLCCLLSWRDARKVLLSHSQTGVDGDPQLPSRFLLATPENDLPRRILQLTTPPQSPRPPRSHSAGWKWSLPPDCRRSATRIRPTDFAKYLECPFRFYLQRVLHLEETNPDSRELDALQFGDLVHGALEEFGRNHSGETSARRIEGTVIEVLESLAQSRFGKNPSPAVRVQLEAAKLRLKAFARVQADEYAKGWRIIAAEQAFGGDGNDRLQIAGLPVRGKIDRVERHSETGRIRVMDYKTYTSVKTPAQTHFGPRLADEWLTGATIQVGGKSKRWADLQLPVYRWLLESSPGDIPGNVPPECAYFVLPADPDGAGIQTFDELDESVYKSALRCARSIAERIAGGNFWPPRVPRYPRTDPFADLFLSGRPEDCIASETIAFLEGSKHEE